MNIRTILNSLLLTIISVVVAIYVIKSSETNIVKTMVGNYLFEQTNLEGTEIKKIIVKTKNMQATLFYQDQFWRIKEADGYYADLVSINRLFQDINQAKIEAEVKDIKQTEDVFADKGTFEIITYNDQGKLLDNIFIGQKHDKYKYAKSATSSQIYLVSGSFELANKLYYWLQQPLLSLRPDSISSVIIHTERGQQVAFRPEDNSPFYNLKQEKININPLLDKFVLFSFIDVKKAENTPLKDMKPEKILVLFTKSGLIYGIEIYQLEDKYWVKIDLSISKLPTKSASEYIKGSRFLYQGWYFKIDSITGKYLLNYQIN